MPCEMQARLLSPLRLGTAAKELDRQELAPFNQWTRHNAGRAMQSGARKEVALCVRLCLKAQLWLALVAAMLAEKNLGCFFSFSIF